MHASHGRSTGLGLALVSAFAFGGSGVAAKPLIEAGLDPLHVVWLRVTGAALVMLPVAWRHRRLVRERPALLAGFGLFAVAGVQACYFAALSRIPVGVALLVEYLAPALVLGWVRFVQRRPVTRAAALGVVLAVCGLACVVEVWAGLSFDAVGLLLAFGAACCQVGYFVLSDQGSGDTGSTATPEPSADVRHEGDAPPADGELRTPRVTSSGGTGGPGGAGPAEADPPHPFGVIAYGLLVGAAVLTVVARPWGMDRSVLAGSAGMNGHEVPAWLLLGWIVLLATVLAYVTGVVSVRLLSPAVAGVVACLEAVIATVLAWVLLGEHLSAPQLVGGGVVLIGALIAQSTAPRPPSGPVATGAGGPEPAGARGSAEAEGELSGRPAAP
ncbi:EamA family transporter [Streptomyces griseus]|uniref:EamA family transporter n=1 Tax=Streptomyces griseus TaxID=1911 RepID=UPI0008402A36|nr:EamA family transporter [Streptomyces griseus]